MPYVVTFPNRHPEFPGQLVVIRISGDDADGTKLAKTVFGLGIDLMVDGDFPQAVRDRVVNRYPDATEAEQKTLWRRNIYWYEYTGSPILTARVCAESDLPADRYFRDAWEYKSGKVDVNMAKARSSHLHNIRTARDAELLELDLAFMRSLEKGDTREQGRISTKKEELRDLPQTFDLTTDPDTPEALIQRWPAELARGAG